jgi:hypothetical protein
MPGLIKEKTLENPRSQIAGHKNKSPTIPADSPGLFFVFVILASL